MLAYPTDMNFIIFRITFIVMVIRNVALMPKSNLLIAELLLIVSLIPTGQGDFEDVQHKIDYNSVRNLIPPL